MCLTEPSVNVDLEVRSQPTDCKSADLWVARIQRDIRGVK